METKTKNIDHPKIKELITSGLWKAIDHGMGMRGSFEESKLLIDKTFKSLPQDFVDTVNEADSCFLGYPEITVEITTKKKGKVIWAEFHKQDMIGQIIEIDERAKSFLHFKQRVHGGFNEEEKVLYIRNAVPKKFCCDALKSQFKFCTQHGLNCPDNFITANAKGEFYMHAVNATYGLSFCPYCGTQHDENFKKD